MSRRTASRYLGLVAVLALASCAPTEPEPPREFTWSCLRDQGCPSRASLPPCPEGLEATSVEEAWARVGSTSNGSRVSVRGPLGVYLSLCSLVGCVPDRCCQECLTTFGMGAEAALRERRYGETIQLNGPGLGCHGDESLQCCTFEAAGQEVIAQGTFQKLNDTQYILADTTLCAPRHHP